MHRGNCRDAQPDDRPILARGAEDMAAFGDFYACYSPRVLRYFARRILDREAARDLTGETFTVALEHLGQFRGRTEVEEQGWVFAIARSQLSRHFRRGQCERAALARVAMDTPARSELEIERVEELADLRPLRRDLQLALHGLPAAQSRAIGLRVLRECSYREAAAALGVSEQVVRARVSRGVRELGARLRELQAA